jgi:hypothetical protein
MPRLTILLLSLMLGAGSAVLVSCGGDDGPSGPGIPSADADGMLAELERARAAFEAGDCAEVEESAEQIAANAQNLADNDPPLDPEIEEGLTQGAARLAELASSSPECEQQTTTTTDEEKTTTTEPTTTAEPTTTEETTTTTTTAEEEPATPDDGGDDGGGPPSQPPGPPSDGGTGTGGTGDGGDRR